MHQNRIRALSLALALLCLTFTACSPKPADPVPTETQATRAPTDVPEESPTEKETAAPTEKPASVKTIKTKTVFADFSDRTGVPEISGKDGWDFDYTGYPKEFSEGKLIFSEVAGKGVKTRINLLTEQRDACANALGTADCIGFYFENNSEEPVGLAWFGESRIPGMEGEEHQNDYLYTFFDDIECYLIDGEGNVLKGAEYWSDNSAFMDRGLCEIPAGFRGYFVVALEDLGSDRCLYAAWGSHAEEDCQNGRWTEGSSIQNVGFTLLAEASNQSGTFAVGEYILVDFE